MPFVHWVIYWKHLFGDECPGPGIQGLLTAAPLSPVPSAPSPCLPSGLCGVAAEFAEGPLGSGREGREERKREGSREAPKLGILGPHPGLRDQNLALSVGFGEAGHRDPPKTPSSFPHLFQSAHLDGMVLLSRVEGSGLCVCWGRRLRGHRESLGTPWLLRARDSWVGPSGPEDLR